MINRIVVVAASLLLPHLSLADNAWSVVPANSRISFIGKQAGAQFQGDFEKFSGTVVLDPKDGAQSRIDVTIEVGSVNSQDDERDATLRGPEMLWAKRYPQARYVAESVVAKSAKTFMADGRLTLRGETRVFPIQFTFDSSGPAASMTGTALLKRLEFGVGKGEWASTEWVADEVTVKFKLQLQRQTAGAPAAKTQP